MPYETAPVELPEAFSALLSLVNRLPVVRLDGKPGLLATYELGPAVKAELTDLTDEVEKLVAMDLVVMSCPSLLLVLCIAVLRCKSSLFFLFFYYLNIL